MPDQACKEIQSSRIGQASSNLAITHQVPSGQEKILVTKLNRNTLCPNTGVLATLLVNGKIATQVVLEGENASLLCNAKPGDVVVAVASLCPLMNPIACIELGEALVILNECELVGSQVAVPPPETINSYNWESLCNKLPPSPDELKVTGTVELPSAHWTAKLVLPATQGINPEILLLELSLTREADPIPRPQVVVQQQVTYSRSMKNCTYKQVQITYKGKVIAEIPVKDVF
jgi:hypothetical protein